MSRLAELEREARRLARPSKAKASSWFFRTGVGEYGDGDQFLGLTVPDQRRLVRKYRDLPLSDVRRLLRSPYHEHRLMAVLWLGDQFRRGNEKQQAAIVRLYLASTRYINNWDIVDSSAPHILGNFFLTRSRARLTRLAKSQQLWERRIAIIATQTFIRHGEFQDTIKIAAILVNDQHDLIQKAVGWMLREVGDRDRKLEERFLRRFAARMPRTMLRYAIEKFPPADREHWLARKSA